MLMASLIFVMAFFTFFYNCFDYWNVLDCLQAGQWLLLAKQWFSLSMESKFIFLYACECDFDLWLKHTTGYLLLIVMGLIFFFNGS